MQQNHFLTLPFQKLKTIHGCQNFLTNFPDKFFPLIQVTFLFKTNDANQKSSEIHFEQGYLLQWIQLVLGTVKTLGEF